VCVEHDVFICLSFFSLFWCVLNLIFLFWGVLGGGVGEGGGAFWKYHNHVTESLPAHDDEGREFGIIRHNNNMPQGA